jgi:hypothetical protein
MARRAAKIEDRQSSYWHGFMPPQELKGSARRFNAGNLPIPTTRPLGAPEGAEIPYNIRPW